MMTIRIIGWKFEIDWAGLTCLPIGIEPTEDEAPGDEAWRVDQTIVADLAENGGRRNERESVALGVD